MLALSLILGAVAGLVLGLTGGGGAILAVPMLVYGLSVTPLNAVMISLVAVGFSALAGFLSRIKSGHVDLVAGAVFSLGGIAGAPGGSFVAERMSPALLLALFALLLAGVGLRMWMTSITLKPGAELDESRCERKGFGPQCVLILTSAGLLTGFFSGLFGVGGGFIVVPALVLATGMGIRRAASTSLMVIAIVSAAALGSALFHGRTIPWLIAAPFFAGSLMGMVAGSRLGVRVPAARIQQGFALCAAGLSMFMLADVVAS